MDLSLSVFLSQAEAFIPKQDKNYKKVYSFLLHILFRLSVDMENIESFINAVILNLNSIFALRKEISFVGLQKLL